MPHDCTAVRPLLPHVADGDADPVEAMHAARHVSDCTACRILLARERRLAAMLEDEMEDCFPIDENFVEAVMASLPKDPPRPRRAAQPRVLKLAERR